jgi:hypothetical protein
MRYFLVLAGVSLFAAGKPEDDLAATVKTFLGRSFVNDWSGLEKLPKITWAPLPPNMPQNCLPDGGCFTRQGAAIFGDRKLAAVVTGARTITSNVYLRNAGVPLGESAVLGALKEAGVATTLARCPLPGGTGGTNWYKLSGAAIQPGVLSVQSSCNGKPCEGFVLTAGTDLPPLQPNQLKLYSEQCSVPESDRRPVSTSLPHEQLAQTLAALISAGSTDWKSLIALPTGIQWSPGPAPKQGDLTFKNDPNQWMHTGNLNLSGRQFSLLVSGTQAQVKNIYFDEGGLHPRGEHLLGVMYAPLGFQVKLVRCGPIYTESTNNWYNLTSAKTQPVMLKQSIRYEGQRVQDSYELRLDGTLPARDPRDREPGVSGCR